LIGVNWKAVKQIDKKYLEKNKIGLEYSNPKRIGVDEVAYQKGHKYLTVVRDVDLHQVIWVGESEPFFAAKAFYECGVAFENLRHAEKKEGLIHFFADKLFSNKTNITKLLKQSRNNKIIAGIN